jgi:hypothetical protein
MRICDVLYVIKCKLLGIPLPHLIVTYTVDGEVKTKVFRYGQKVKLP